MSATSHDLRDRNALVTGAGRGIGAAIAKGLAAAGVRVWCLARTTAEVDAVSEAIRSDGGQAEALVADVTDRAAMAAVAARIASTDGGLDIAFLNAGGNIQIGTIADSDPDAWMRAIELNFVSVFHGLQAVVPLMRQRGGGRILFTGSAMAAEPARRKSSYCAGKAGARMLVRVAAAELRDENITVNEIVPGPTVTDAIRLSRALEDPESPFNIPGEWAKPPEAVVPLALMLAGYPGLGPTGQVFSLARR